MREKELVEPKQISFLVEKKVKGAFKKWCIDNDTTPTAELKKYIESKTGKIKA